MTTLKFNTYWNEKQKEAFSYLLWHPEVTEIWYWGAAWWGKSYTGVSWIWMMCNKYPWVRYFFWRQELKRLKQTTLATYFKFLWDYKIPEQQKWVYNSQDSTIRFSNGSEILLLDLAYLPSDPLYTRFGSLELTGWYIDESAEIDEQCITILMTRIWRQKNDEYWLAPKLLEWFNPDKWQVYRRYYKPWKEWTLPKYRVFIRALATDNKRLPSSYIAQLQKANEVTKQRLLHWNFDYDDTPWRLFIYDKIMDLTTNPRYNWEKYITCDVARKWKDTAVIRVWDGYEEIDRAVFERCLNVDIENKIKEFSYKYNVWMSNTIVDEDWVWGGIVDHLRCKWFINGSSAIQPLEAKYDETKRVNFSNLKTQCYFELARLVNLNKIRVLDKDFGILAEELDVIVEVDIDKDGKKKIISKEDVKAKLGRSPDASDSLMMRCYFEINKMDVVDENNFVVFETDYSNFL